ncbi:PREDICTED: uncharacterized protein LOC106108230 [Papilio polytes]|uniref:uncharacterized protein LOC106108230 n=1 Tax=Papilio polytes TaxID=76194 RepID=UPI00067691C2|nr:PREDICTED: uncharacterized protein LOC106108230 [Papilio polytes]
MRKVTNTRASVARAAATASKLGASTPNGGSRPRTPTGLLTPASGRFTSGGIYRTSSIPTLSPVPALVRSGSFAFAEGQTPGRSRIPVLKDQHTNSNLTRQRTPSGSSTPVRPGQQTATSRLLRKKSDASDSGAPTTPLTRRGTPANRTTEKREPFRL